MLWLALEKRRPGQRLEHCFLKWRGVGRANDSEEQTPRCAIRVPSLEMTLSIPLKPLGPWEKEEKERPEWI